MTYDLRFRFDKTNASTVRDFLESQGPVTFEGDSLCYESDHTDVYFTGELEHDDTHTIWRFDINFNRPRSFGLESAAFFEALCNVAPAEVDDSQMANDGWVAFDRCAYTKCYLEANERFTRHWLQTRTDHPDAFPVVHGFRPKEELEAIWRWNYNAGLIADNAHDPDFFDDLVDAGASEFDLTSTSMAEQVFLPTVMVAEEAGAVRTFCVWGDGMPILLPRVDFVVIARDRLQPAGVQGMCRVAWDDLPERVRDCEIAHACLEARSIKLEHNADLDQFISELSPMQDRLTRIPLYGVYELEFNA